MCPLLPWHEFSNPIGLVDISQPVYLYGVHLCETQYAISKPQDWQYYLKVGGKQSAGTIASHILSKPNPRAASYTPPCQTTSMVIRQLLFIPASTILARTVPNAIIHLCHNPSITRCITSTRFFGGTVIAAGIYIMGSTWIEGRRIDLGRKVDFEESKDKILVASNEIGVSDAFNLADVRKRVM